jgi:hypothetical protein
MKAASRRWMAALLVAAVSCTAGAVRAAGPNEAVATVSALERYRNGAEAPIYDLDSGSVRWVPAIHDIDPTPRRSDRDGKGGPLLFIWRQGDDLLCSCSHLLRPGEYLISEAPVRDADSRRYVSVDDASFKELTMLAGYAGTTPDLAAAALANLVYANNEDAIRAVLTARGFETVYAYGFFGAAAPAAGSYIHFFIARQAATGAIYLAIRGTNDVGDLTTNLSAEAVPWDADGKTGLVHKGFRDAARAIVKLAGPILIRLHRDHPDAPMIVTGHSLGAALAALVTVALDGALPDMRALGLAMPPIGTPAFVSAESVPLARVTAYYVSHDEIRELDRFARTEHLQWVGHEVGLGDMGKTAGHYHYVINYLKGFLAAHHLPIAPFEDQMPICTLRGTPCFTDRHEVLLPLCVLADARCVARTWPRMADWLAGRASDAPGDRRATRRIEAAMVADPPSDDIRPLLFLELAALHAATDHATARRFWSAAQAEVGGTWLVRAVRDRLADQSADATGNR